MEHFVVGDTILGALFPKHIIECTFEIIALPVNFKCIRCPVKSQLVFRLNRPKQAQGFKSFFI